MVKVCASCNDLKDADTHTSEGWLCRPCVRSASTVIETLYINGQRFHRCLKGLSPKRETPTALTAGASGKE